MEDRVKLEHFRNLIALCAADGQIDPTEKEALIAIAASLDIARERLEVMLDHAHEYISLVPQNTTDREKQLEEMMNIAFADGQFTPSERSLVRAVALKLGFTAPEAAQFIEAYVQRH